MYAWIDQSDGAGPPTQETKRKIRSHVTRSLALQRRKDEGKAPSYTQIVALDGDSAWRRHKYKKRTTDRKPSTKAILQTENVSQDAGCDHKYDNQQSSSDSGSQQDVPLPLDEHLTPNGPSDNESLQSCANNMVVRTPAPETMLTIWSDNIPMHGDVMLRICAFQMHRLRPDVSIEQASDVTGSVWSNSPCAILSYALSLASLGHLHSTTSGSGNDVVGMFKGKVFREMIKRLPVMEKIMTDEMVPSILCLTSFELSRTSLEARTHLQALNAIRKLEQQKGVNEFPIMFEALDILHSLMFDLPTVTQVESTHLLDTEDVTNMFTFLQEEQGNLTGGDRTKSTMLWDIEELLVHLRALMSEVVEGSPPEELPGALFYDNLEDFRSTYCAATSHSVQDQYLSRCCYHTFAILYNVLVNRRPFRHTSNKKHATGLYFPIQANLRESWDDLPRLKLWILVVALSASGDAGEQSLFQDHIATTVYQSGTAAWDGIKSCLCSFLRTRSQLDALADPPTTKRTKAKRKSAAPSSSQSISSPQVQLATPSPSSSATSSASNTTSNTTSSTTSNTNPSTTSHLPHPRFIPLPSHSLTATMISKSQIYPELGRKYPFTPTKDLAIEAEEEEMILHKGYEYLAQDSRFGSMIMKGAQGRISFIGTSLQNVGWVALF